MKYLVTVTLKQTTLPPRVIADMLEDQRNWLRQGIDAGVLECAYGFVNGTRVGIVNVNSAQELNELLVHGPSFAISEFEVRPLTSVDSAVDNGVRALRHAEQSRRAA
jgi:hypothetical protein